MKILIFDGSANFDPMAGRVLPLLQSTLAAGGHLLEILPLRDLKFAFCAGCFDCWIRTPGICRFDDDNRRVASAFINSDLVIFATPVTFGGYSGLLKRAVDHLIQNISPYFVNLDGEIHHRKRYPKYPDFLALGWQERFDPVEAAVFRRLAWRNAINFYAERSACGVLVANQTDRELAQQIGGLLDSINSGQRLSSCELPEQLAPPATEPKPIRKALLLVGSPRSGQSTSNAMQRYLAEQLTLAGVECKVNFIYSRQQKADRSAILLQEADWADLIVLAYPLYVDSLPAPVIETLEVLAESRHTYPEERQPLFATLSNCGFPEASQISTSLAICENFARQNNMIWAGGLALGGGHGLGQRPLAEWGGRTQNLRQAIDQAAAELARGRPIPLTAQSVAGYPAIPAWIFARLAGRGWKKLAKPHDAGHRLNDQPY